MQVTSHQECMPSQNLAEPLQFLPANAICTHFQCCINLQGTLLGSWNGNQQKFDASAPPKAGSAARGKSQKVARGPAARQLTGKASTNCGPSKSRPQTSRGQAQLHADGSMKSGSRAGSLYDLFCVICHRGSLAGGHYTAFLRCGPQWFLCDDACLMAVAVADVAACQPYMLFYSRTNQFSAPSLHAR